MAMFDSTDVKAVMAGTASRGTVMAVLTSQTCGEPCWHAREEICRCSCGGRNHGCLRTADGERPERTAKINGHRYRLKAVGRYSEISEEAREINKLAGFKCVEKPRLVINGIGSSWTPEDITAAVVDGEETWWNQYRYTWATTDSGAPARLKSVSANQRAWPEVQGFHAERSVYLLWERIEMPEKPTVLAVDKMGRPLANQIPEHCHL